MQRSINRVVSRVIELKLLHKISIKLEQILVESSISMHQVYPKASFQTEGGSTVDFDFKLDVCVQIN